MKSHFRKIYSIVLVLTLIFVSPFINLFTTQTIAATIEIDDWYVTTNSAKRFYLWNTIPSTVYVYKFSGMSDYFTSGMRNGVTSWKNRLGISMGVITTTTQNSISSGIKFFGGTENQLNSLGIWSYGIIYDNDVAGYTYPTAFLDQNNAYVITYPAETVYYNIYITQSMNGFIKKRSSDELSKYYNLCIHELGHALGWYGHTYDVSSVMYYTGPTDLYTLSNIDVNHVKQFYD